MKRRQLTSRAARSGWLGALALFTLAGVAAGQETAEPCATLRGRLAAAGAATPREMRLLEACDDEARAAPLSRIPAFRAMLAQAQLTMESVSTVQSASYWGSLWYNSERAATTGRTGVWAGRGATAAASVGAWGRAGVLSYAARPIVFAAENRSFTPSKSREPIGFQNPWLPGVIDAPYRFGSSAFVRFDPGESYARIDAGPIAAGISNAAQSWGPAQAHPLVLGRETGFPHLFIESARPVSVGIGDLSSRWIMGRLGRTSYAPERSARANRGIVGITGAFSPRGLRGLSVGGTRLFTFYPNDSESAATYALLPISGLVKTASNESFESNQIGSVFARLAPSTTFELYGEFMRDDHNWDVRDLFGEPDHASGWVAGLTWRQRDTVRHRIRSFTLERANTRISHLSRVRPELPAYTHHVLVEGHTHRGLVLGSSAALGGGALSAIFDQRGAASGWTLVAEVVHDAQDDEGGTWLGRPAGHFSFGLAREVIRGQRSWTWDARVQPGFGDIPGANFQLTLSADGLISP